MAATTLWYHEPILYKSSSVESFYSLSNDYDDEPLPPPQPKHAARSAATNGSLQLKTPTTPRHRRYQSDEEIPSPVASDRDYSDGTASQADGETSCTDDAALDVALDLDTLETLGVAVASCVTVVAVGRPSLVDVHRLAPMQPRRRRPALTGSLKSPPPPASAASAGVPPLPLPRRSSRRGRGHRPQRSLSMYDAPPSIDPAVAPEPQPFTTPTQAHFASAIAVPTAVARAVTITNFSTPHRTGAVYRARPAPLHHESSGRTSTSSSRSSSSLATDPSSVFARGPDSPAESEGTLDDSDDVGDALLRESAEVHVRTRSSERARQLALGSANPTAWYAGSETDTDAEIDTEEHSWLSKRDAFILTPPTPTSYAAYDPYALEPPRLSTDWQQAGRRGSATNVATAAKKGWRGLGRVGRMGRRDAFAI